MVVREGLLGAVRLAPSGPPFGRSTWPGARLSNPLFSVEGSLELMAFGDREDLPVTANGGERGTTRRCAPRPFGAALRAFNLACGQVVEPAFLSVEGSF